LIDVLLDEMMELLIFSDGLLNGGSLFAKHIPGHVLAVLAVLVVVIRAAWPLSDDGEFAAFQTLDLSGLAQQR